MYKLLNILTAIGGVIFLIFMIIFNSETTSVLEWLFYIPVILLVLWGIISSILGKEE